MRFSVLLLLLPFLLNAQVRFEYDTSIQVTDEDGIRLASPWVGGLNSAQYNTIDLDGDNKDDLLLFDKMGRKVLTYLQKNNSYTYAPDYESLFPAEVANFSWILLRDFNGDGRKDLFAGELGQIYVYKNEMNPEGSLSWSPMEFFLGENIPRQRMLVSFRPEQNEFSGIFINPEDIPSITDVDGDGDFDLFTMRNGETIEFHKNMGIEDYNTQDSIKFVRQTMKWGDIQICGCNAFDLNNTNCGGNNRVKHSKGRFLLAGDFTGDDKIDLLFSQAECNFIFLIENHGTVDQPEIISIETRASFPTFPAAYFEDVDFDGLKDLMATPTMSHREDLIIDLARSNSFYKNVGDGEQPDFYLQRRDFLQSDMIDLGDNAVPSFTDADNDADLDLFISANADAGYAAKLIMLQNQGDRRQPYFQVTTTDYLELSARAFYNLKAQFADLNNDNATDLVFTATSANDNETKLYYIPNKSSQNLSLDAADLQIINLPIVSTENICVEDINEDGFPDVLLGRNNGALEYWENTASSISPTFVLKDEQYLGIGSSIVNQNLKCEIADFDHDGKQDLLFAGQSGILQLISDFKSSSVSEATNIKIENKTFGRDEEPNLGAQLWPVAADLYNTGFPLIVTGTTLGGVRVLRNLNEVFLFPNPYSRGDVMQFKTDERYMLRVYTNTGKLIYGPHLIEKNVMVSSVLPDLAAGFYIFRFQGNNKSFSEKIVVR